MTNEDKPHMKTLDEFMDIYSASLREYLSIQFKHKQKNHIEDIAVNTAAFSEAFYITIGNLY